jgi:hypothetical protein
VVAAGGAGTMSEAARTKCREPRCRSALPVPTDNPRRAFCARSCYDRFHRTRCRVCAEPSPNGRLHARKCSHAHRQSPELYAYQKLQKQDLRGSSQNAFRDERNPIKQGFQARAKCWGPALSDDAFWLASLPLDPDTKKQVARGNDPERNRRLTAWGRPKVLFGPGTPPRNVIGGYRFAAGSR